MKSFTLALAASAIGSVVSAWPTPTTTSDAAPSGTSSVTIPPVPSDPSLIAEWVDQFLADLTTTTWATIGQKGLSELMPHFSLDWLAKYAAFGASELPPNYNTNFDAVDGVAPNLVKWLVEANNRTKDDPVILFLHGGGYSLPALPMHATNLWNLYQQLDNDRVSILWLDYTLTLQAPYPTQLRQATAVYNQLAKSCDNILIEGDSAGGHLSLNMLRTINYPVDTVESLQAPPRALGLLSPAVTFGIYPFNGTMLEYQGRDLIDAQALNQMGAMLSLDNLELQYSVFFNQWKDDIDWKSILPDPANIFTSYGENEVLRGPIETFLDLAFGGHTSDASGSTVFMEADGQHDGIIRGTTDAIWEPWVSFHKKVFASN